MNLRDTIIPKSDQLNYDDVLTGPITITIKTLKAGNDQQPVVIVPEDENVRDYKPCKSMRRVLIAIWGDKGKDWIGQRMTIYGDPTVKYGGVEVGGLRISHMTGMDAPVTLKLTATRGKRADYTVQPLVAK
jgi:hypothetical protein